MKFFWQTIGLVLLAASASFCQAESSVGLGQTAQGNTSASAQVRITVVVPPRLSLQVNNQAVKIQNNLSTYRSHYQSVSTDQTLSSGAVIRTVATP